MKPVSYAHMTGMYVAVRAKDNLEYYTHLHALRIDEAITAAVQHAEGLVRQKRWWRFWMWGIVVPTRTEILELAAEAWPGTSPFHFRQVFFALTSSLCDVIHRLEKLRDLAENTATDNDTMLITADDWHILRRRAP